MRVLFMFIVTLVFGIGSLISPNDFTFQPTMQLSTPQPTAAPTSIVSQPNEANMDDETYIYNPITFTPISTPTSMTNEPAQGFNPGFVPESAPAAISKPVSESASESEFRIDLYEPKVEDTFERGSSGFGINAGLNDDENIRIIALNNRLSLIPKKNNGWINWRLRPPVIQSGAAEMEFSIATCARGDRFGIVMHADDYTSGKGYYFSLACEGTVSILRDTTVLSTADASAAFNNNSGDINVMIAVIENNTLSLMLNGNTILTAEDNAYTQGFSGFFTSPMGQDTLTMDILSFKEFYNEG